MAHNIKNNILLLFIILFLTSNVFASELLSLQGKALYEGVFFESGSVIVTIHDASTGGNQIYSESFPNAIDMGFFDLVLGNSTVLNFELGRTYYLDLTVNGTDIDFEGKERALFQPGVGAITNYTEIIDMDVTGNLDVSGVITGNGSGITDIGASSVQDVWVDQSGDMMTGNLNMTGNNITELISIYGEGINPYLRLSNLLGSYFAYGSNFLFADSSSISLYTSNSNAIYVNGSGDVGIGTTSPSQKLDVNGTIQFKEKIRSSTGNVVIVIG